MKKKEYVFVYEGNTHFMSNAIICISSVKELHMYMLYSFLHCVTFIILDIVRLYIARQISIYFQV